MTKSKLDIASRSDCDRRVLQADRIARVLRVMSLIQSGRNYDVKAIAKEVGCSERTVARDLKTLSFAGVPWYFDKASKSYRLPPGYRFPVRLQTNGTRMIENHTIRASYRDYFEIDQPFNGLEIEFVARWIHENHNFSELHQTPAMKWNLRWKLPPVALANFYTVFTDAFTGNPGALIATVWQTNVPFMAIPWRTESHFRERDQVVCEWLRQYQPASIVDIGTVISEFRSHK